MQLEIDAKYDVYLKRQTADVDAFRRDEGLVLADVDYAEVPGLSNEARTKLRGRAAAHDRAGGPARRNDAGGAGILAAYLAPRGEAEDSEGERVAFHVKQRGRDSASTVSRRSASDDDLERDDG